MPRALPLRVLLVDDDESLRRALERSLRLAGLEVAAFGSAEEALALATLDAETFLVLDVLLPGIDGIALRRRLEQAVPGLPTVFITALQPEDVRARLADLSPRAVLFKPFRSEELLEAIEGAAG